MPFNADLERIVLKIAQVEWKSTVRATRRLDGGCGSETSLMVKSSLL